MSIFDPHLYQALVPMVQAQAPDDKAWQAFAPKLVKYYLHYMAEEVMGAQGGVTSKSHVQNARSAAQLDAVCLIANDWPNFPMGCTVFGVQTELDNLREQILSKNN